MPDKKQSLLLGGIVIGLLGTSYLGVINMLCCAGVWGGALVAVWHYTDTYELTLPAGKGATLGVLAALIGAGISLVLNLVLNTAGIRSDQFFLELLINNFGDSVPPEAAEAWEDQLNTPFTVGSFILNTLMFLPVSAIFGAIGGAIGAMIFKKGGDSPIEVLE